MIPLKKLTPEDIETKSPGKQAKEAILDKYYSIEYFAQEIGMRSATVYQYLKRTDLGSAKFKLKFINAFDKGFNEIILTIEGQIKKFVDTIFHNNIHYTSKSDLVTFKKIMELCNEERMTPEILRMERNEIMYYYNNARYELAIDMMKELIQKAYDKKLYYHWIYFKCDLAFMYGYMADHKKSLELHENLQLDDFHRPEDTNFRVKALYKHYFHYGVVCNRVGKHDKAKKVFEKSLKYAWDNIYKGSAYLGIGLSHKKKGEYDKALEYYFKAKKIQSSIEKIVMLYNNIAEVYKQKEDYDTAMMYIEKALRIIDWYKIKTYSLAYATYLEIKFLSENVDTVLKELMDWINNSNKDYLPKSSIIIALNALIVIIKKVNSYKNLIKVEKLIFDIINQSKERAFIEKLENCLGKISRALHKTNYGRRV